VKGLFTSIYAERFLGTGHIHPFERRNGCYSKLSDDYQLLLLELISYRPARQKCRVCGVAVAASTIYAVQLKTWLESSVNYSYCMLKRAQYMAEMSAFDPAMMVWIDETGCDRRNALYHFGYGIRGLGPLASAKRCMIFCH